MGHSCCCVVNCGNNGINSRCKFYIFPRAAWKLDQRNKWIAAVNRKNVDGSPWYPKPHDTICSEHFIGGKKSDAQASPSYIPTIFPKIYRKKTIMENPVKYASRIHKKCEICDKGRIPQAGIFFARFPRELARCRMWVKAVGLEDLIYIPIEELHELKFICGQHFKPEDFNNKGSRLRKSAIPTLELPYPPLSDELLVDFPLYKKSLEKGNVQTGVLRKVANIMDSVKVKQSSKDNMKTQVATITPMHSISTHGETSQEIFEVSRGEDTDVMDFESDVNISKDRVTMESHPEVPDVAVPFTWHNPSEVIDSGVKDDAQYIGTEIMTDDVLLYNDGKSSAIDTCEIINKDVPTIEGSVSSHREKQLQYHNKEYKCNHCSGPIEGFRYRCVQCVDYDMCAACEARGAHERHYVLRIPGPRPYAEIEAVLQKIKAELLSGSHSVLLEDTQMLDSVKEEIKDEEQDPLVVDPTNPIDPLFGDADDTHSEFMSNVSQSDKAESEQQGYWKDNDSKRTKWKSSDSACEHDNSIHRDDLQTYYSSKRQNSSNKKLISDNRTHKLDEKSHNLDNRKFLITKPGEKYVAIRNIGIVQKTVNIVPNKLSDPKVLVTRLKPLNATGALQSPTGSQLPGIPLKQVSTATVHPSNKPSTPNILKKTPIVIKKLSD